MFWPGRDYSDHGSRVLDSNNARRPSVGRMPGAPPPHHCTPTHARSIVCQIRDVRYEMRCPTSNNHMCPSYESTDRTSWSLQDFSESFLAKRLSKEI